MPTITVHTHPSYKILIDKNDFSHSLSIIKRHLSENKLFIITNTTIAQLYRRKLDRLFKRSLKTVWITIPDGERYKSIETCEIIWIQLTKLGANRSSCLLALGGGVVGDITGFVASTYMRGIRYFQMPTTLLAQVDASIGGKTGIDLPTGKNLVGTFHQPEAVFIHADFLKTLPEREFRCGLAEVVKYALIADKKLWLFLQKNSTKTLNRNTTTIQKLIERCVDIKAHVVSGDEKETGLRRVLNLGHTLGHAIELLGGYKMWKHGEAVAMGLVFAAELSHRLGVSKKNLTPEIDQLLKTFGLPTKRPEFSRKQYLKAMRTDKKSNHFVFLKKFGCVVMKSITTDQMAHFL